MEKEARSILYEVLKVVKTKADLSPKPSPRKEKTKKEVLKRMKNERVGIATSTDVQHNWDFDLMPGKHISIFPNELSRQHIALSKEDFEKVLGKLVEVGVLKDFVFVYKDNSHQGSRYKIILPSDFETIVEKYEEESLGFDSPEGGAIQQNSKLKSTLIVVNRAGELASYNDGTIRYKKEILNLPPRLKELCRLFLEKPERLIAFDDIKDRIIKASRRPNIGWDTISKYVSRLNISLEIHFGKKVIINQREEGWYLKV